MKKTVILLLLIILSGCIKNPTEKVPILKVEMLLNETNGTVRAEEYTITPATIDYIKRPKEMLAESFPTIGGRVWVTKYKNISSSIGPWAYTPYNGPGKYNLTLGFREGMYPVPNDTLHVSIIVVNKKGERIGYVVQNLNWTEPK